MPIPDNPTTPAAVALEDLQKSHRSLCSLFNTVLVLLLILTGFLSLYFLREVSQVRRQVKDLTLMVEGYSKTNLPAMLEIRDKLFDFSKTHPDYRAIFTNFFNPAVTGGADGNLGSSPPESDAGGVRLPSLPPGK